MQDRRQEPFRYKFKDPLPGFFCKTQQRNVSGAIQVDDISLSGLRFTSNQSLQLELKEEVSLSFIFENETFTADGRVIWLNETDGKTACGLHVFAFPKRLRDKIELFGTDSVVK